jgi:dienelactone hydrolase
MPASRRDFLAAAAAASAVGSVLNGGGTLDARAAAAEPATSVPAPPADFDQGAPPAANLGSLLPTVEKLVGSDEFLESFLNERFTSIDEHRTAARAKVLDAFSYRPAPVAPKPEIVDRADCGDHLREKITFSTTPALRVPAYVLIPKGLTKPAPAIIDLHSHGGMFLFGKEKVVDLGRNHPAMTAYHERNYEGRPTATYWVRRGYVVISIDTLMFGERRILMADSASAGWDRSKYSLDDVKRLNDACRSKEPTIVRGLTYAGATWPGVVTWDDLRTLDYLATRPEVDARRIGCVGVSMGGYRSLFLAGLDDRIAAACVTGFMSTVRPMIRAHLETHSFVHFVPHLHRSLDLPDVVALRAPKPLLVQQCSQDRLFPPEGMKASVEKIAAIYAKAGAAGQFDGRFYDVPHIFNRAMQDDALAFFDRHLKP